MRLFDRLAMAFAGLLFGSLTLLAYALIAGLMIRPEAGVGLLALAWSPIGLVYVSVCTLIGAISTPEKLAEWFAWLWGTHGFWESRAGKVSALALGLLILGLLLLRRAH